MGDYRLTPKGIDLLPTMMVERATIRMEVAS